jgi:hypothetical protein
MDMLAGLSGVYILRIPPDFWAIAVPSAAIAINNTPAVAAARRLGLISLPSF